MTVESGILTAAGTVIAKTTQTLMGAVIDVGYHNFITLHCEYQNGDETGVLVMAHMSRTVALDVSQDQGWTVAAGTKTATLNEYSLTDAVPHHIQFDVRGIEFIYFSQGGSSNDGTPTGTIEASYTLK